MADQALERLVLVCLGLALATRTIATLALVCVFIGWFMGYIEMRTAIYVLVAIVFVGSAATIVNSLWGK